MTRLRAFLVTITLLAAGCGGQRFPVDAVGALRAAARQSSSGGAATLRGSMLLDGSELVLLTGTVDMRHRRASISTADARRPARYPPFESRFVDGWTYVGIDSAVRRPSRLSPSANWVAYEDVAFARGLPIPERTVPAGFLFTLVDQLRTEVIANAHFVDQKKNGSTKVQFQLPNLESNPSVKSTYTVSVGPDGRIGEIAIVKLSTQGGKSYEQDERFNLVWSQNTQPVEAPPASEVQRLAPGENLYATDPGATTTTQPPTTSPPTLGPIGESDAIGGNKGLFDADRAALEATLRAQPDPKLTGFSFSTVTNTISVAFAYQHPAQEGRPVYAAFAWHVGQALSDTFWSRELVEAVKGQHADPAWLPKLRIQLDDISFLCPAAVQIAVAVHGISQHDWLQRCAA